MTGTPLTAPQAAGFAARRRRRLVASTVPVSTLEPSTIAEAYAIFQHAYAGADRERFQRDLAEKQFIVLLRDRESSELKGFSTILLQELTEPRRATVIFSGDTVIDREYWGQKQLQLAFARILLAAKLRSRTPLYWFLLSKGYRTYLLLANAFPSATPRFDSRGVSPLQPILDALAEQRFGAEYDRASGVIRYREAHERVRDGVAPITDRLLRNPHVRFFVERNPGHADGDELACVAEVRLRDLARIAMRLTTARARRALRLGARERR